MKVDFVKHEYCNDCPLFQPQTDSIYADHKVVAVQIYCSNYTLCQHLIKYLQSNKKDTARNKKL